MILLLSLFLLFNQASDLPAAKMSAVDFSAVKQGPIREQGCIPLLSRQITFRVKNRSDKTLYIYGRGIDGDYPLGTLIRLDREKNQWLDSEGNTAQHPYSVIRDFIYKEIGGHIDVHVLSPGRSMKFNDFAKETFVGSRVKRIIYISFSPDEEPQMFMSEEFTLR
jgi:hypothetical protein